MKPAPSCLRGFALAALLACSTFSAGRARAEEQDDEKPLGRHRAGQLWWTARLQLRDVGVDDNVFHTFVDPIKDAVVVLGPRLEGVVTGGHLKFTGMGYLETTYYRRQGEERSTDFGGEGRVEVDLRRVTLFGGGGGGQFTNRLSIDVDERLKRQERRGQIGATVRFASRFSLTGQAGGEILDFQEGLLRTGSSVKSSLDRNSVAVGGQLRVGIRPRTGLIASAEALEDKFVSQEFDLPRTHRSYRYLAGFDVRESTTTRLPYGRVLIGVREFPDTIAGRSPFYRGPAITALVEVPMGTALRMRGALERDVVFASSVVSVRDLHYRNAYIYKRYEGRATVAMPAHTDLLLSGGFEEANYLLPYPYPDSSSVALFDRLDHRWTASAGLIWKYKDSFRIGGHVSWVRRVSSLPIFGYEGTVYGIGAEVIP
jgi:Putative beta-barrel porin 2